MNPPRSHDPTGRPLTVLVLGVGGNVSQGILKALAAASLPCRVLAGCISPLSMGLYLSDASWVTPRADDPDFIPWLQSVCAEEGVDVVLSGAEPVLEALAANTEAVREAGGAFCLVSAPDVLEVGQDKLAMARWLEQAGLRAPRSAASEDQEAIRGLVTASGFPLVAKPRRGKGGQDVALVGDEAGLELVSGHAGLVLQEHLGEVDAEYTVGCVVDSEGALGGTLAMRRQLESGTTFRAEAGDFPEVTGYAEAIAQALRPTGPLNVQLRLADGEPVAFELNVRFSGTTPLRARLGFNEVEACLRHFCLGEPLRLPSDVRGTVLRYWNELYVPASARDALVRDRRLADPAEHGAHVEDWGMRR